MKRILITGGATGIGKATAMLAAERGYEVAINFFRSCDAASNVTDELEGRGVRVISVQADVSREEHVIRMFETVDEEFGTLDALVNNATHLELQSRLDQMDAARLERTLGVNVIGSFLCAREAVRRMSTLYGGKGGAIVNVSSGAAQFGSPGEYIDYASSKGAIETMTIGLAREVARESIRVNGVRPGFIDTDIHLKSGEPGRIERVRSLIPMRRIGSPQEVAHSILWLLSAEASYVTGAILDVSGGR